MKIICCGDSYFSLDKSLPGTHLSEILEKKFNAEMLNFAKPGASNFFTCLQIEHALDYKPDLLIFGFTTPGRIEIPIEGKSFNIGTGIFNIRYEDKFVSPSFYDTRKVTTISQSFPNLEQTSVIKNYISNLYDDALKRKQDHMLVTGMLYRLKSLGQKFIFTRGGLTLSDKDYAGWAEFEVDYATECPWHWSTGPTEYHCPVKKEAELAELWFQRINKLYNFV